MAGVAMGMVSRENEGQISDYRILTDLLVGHYVSGTSLLNVCIRRQYVVPFQY